VLSYITDNYVTEVDGDSLIDGAITGMLERLDPHSTYLDPDRNKKMQERNRGAYYGIGVSFSIVDGNLTVISPSRDPPPTSSESGAATSSPRSTASRPRD